MKTHVKLYPLRFDDGEYWHGPASRCLYWAVLPEEALVGGWVRDKFVPRVREGIPQALRCWRLYHSIHEELHA